MDKTKWIAAKQLKPGDIIAWNSGYYDIVKTVSDNRIGDIVVNCNDDTATMIFLPNDVLRIVKL